MSLPHHLLGALRNGSNASGRQNLGLLLDERSSVFPGFLSDDMLRGRGGRKAKRPSRGYVGIDR